MQGGGALAVPIVLFGNRNYDDALAELQALLGEDGFLPVAAGAFVGEHSFSRILGAGRPDDKDMVVIHEFVKKIYEKISSTGERESYQPLNVGGEYPSAEGPPGKSRRYPEGKTKNFRGLRRL